MKQNEHQLISTVVSNGDEMYSILGQPLDSLIKCNSHTQTYLYQRWGFFELENFKPQFTSSYDFQKNRIIQVGIKNSKYNFFHVFIF